MNITIDVSHLSSLSHTRGIGIYTSKLFQTLSRVDKRHHYSLAKFKRPPADLIHFPFFDPFFLNLPFSKTSKWVVTVHDVIPLIYPKHFPPGIRGRIKFLIQKHNLLRADAIITDSRSSKTDIVHYLNINPKKIHVIYLGVGKEFKPHASKASLSYLKKVYNLNRPYVLYVGDVNYNKNLPGLLEAFAQASQDIDLVLVSRVWKKKIPEVNNLNEIIVKLNLTDRVKKIKILASRFDLTKLYNAALIYVQPSLYEGFGLPVLEAMACGTPVVATNVASLPEICGSAAIMVKPTATDISAGIKQVLAMNSRQRQSLIRAGLAQAAKFTWAKTARETIKVYNKVLNRS